MKWYVYWLYFSTFYYISFYDSITSTLDYRLECKTACRIHYCIHCKSHARFYDIKQTSLMSHDSLNDMNDSNQNLNEEAYMRWGWNSNAKKLKRKNSQGTRTLKTASVVISPNLIRCSSEVSSHSKCNFPILGKRLLSSLPAKRKRLHIQRWVSSKMREIKHCT